MNKKRTCLVIIFWSVLYAGDNDRHYQMLATFFAGEFTDGPSSGAGEHELHWLPVMESEFACFHACHAWAVRQA